MGVFVENLQGSRSYSTTEHAGMSDLVGPVAALRERPQTR